MAFLDARARVRRAMFYGIPRTHYQTLANLPPELVAPLYAQVRAVSAAMSAFGAGGSFVGVNNTVDQSVPHLHVHVVPRTRRDGVHGTASLMISVFGRILAAPPLFRRRGGHLLRAHTANELASDHVPPGSSAPNCREVGRRSSVGAACADGSSPRGGRRRWLGPSTRDRRYSAGVTSASSRNSWARCDWSA